MTKLPLGLAALVARRPNNKIQHLPDQVTDRAQTEDHEESVERARKVSGHSRCQRAEASVEMVIMGIDEFERDGHRYELIGDFR